MTRRRAGVLALLAGANLLLIGGGRWLHAPRPGRHPATLGWNELTREDWIYELWTRVATLEGQEVHYPTPVEELARLLEPRRESEAHRHRAEALRRLGDWKGAWSAMGAWAEASGSPAWADAARWAASHRHFPEAFEAFERARGSLAGDDLRALSQDAIRWADAHPGVGDPLELRTALADAFPEDPALFRDLVAALREAGQMGELAFRVAHSRALPAEELLVLRAEVAAERSGAEQGFLLLDPEATTAHGDAFDKAFAGYVDRARPALPDTWRSTLEKDWDRESFARLCAYLEGHGRGDAVKELAGQMERRHPARLTRRDRVVLAGLLESAGDVEEAFRMRLAAAALGDDGEQRDDLAELGRLALAAGAAPLPVGRFRDEGMRLVARMDRTPGIWSGGLAFLLTGQDWPSELAGVERAALGDRTFALAGALAAELEGRASRHPGLPALWNRIAQRHLDRGEGEMALATVRKVRFGTPEEREEARRLATVAMRQVTLPLEEEVETYRKRLLHLWPTGGDPVASSAPAEPGEPVWDEEGEEGETDWRDVYAEEEDVPVAAPSGYREVLDEAVARLDERDRTHQAALRLILAEMDRHQEDEELWLDLAERLSAWSLDDDLGPRYERAAARFEGPGVWQKLARWYARRSRLDELDRLASELVASFRESELFDRAEAGKLDVELPVSPRPRAAERVMLVPYADLVRLRALERFPHSPRVVDEALSALARYRQSTKDQAAPDVARLGALGDARSAAVLFVDDGRRADYLSAKMRDRSLETFLEGVAKEPADPVRDRILLDGWARLSRFDLAAPAADRLLASYPGDPSLVTEALQLHRSLSAIADGQAQLARQIVEREEAVLQDPGPALTEVGELLHDRGRIDEALEVWSRIGKLDIHDRARVEELATLYWDYDHMKEALEVVEQARTRMQEPWLLAFEAAVLREELGDLPGAIQEYVATLAESDDWSTGERASRRLAQLSGRGTVRAAIESAIASCVPGQPTGEDQFVRLLQLASVTESDLGYDDDWIDDQDLPRDPVGQEERQDAREAARAGVVAGIEKNRSLLIDKAIAMARGTSRPTFVGAVEARRSDLAAASAEGDAELQAVLLRKRAELETTPEGRVRIDCQLLAFLVEKGRTQEADALAAELWPRAAALPEGAARMRAEVVRPWFVERRDGVDAAAVAWGEIARAYPWSLGILEDRQAFLLRTGRRPEARAALEEASGRAAPSHRVAFLARLADDAMTQAPVDLDLGRRALDGMLASPGLGATDRRRAAALRIKLAIRAKEEGDVVALAASQCKALARDERADAWSELARTASGEGAHAPATHMWIEALKLRIDPGWLREACTTAERGDKLDVLQRFYEEQVKASPRDVRGLAALRDVAAYRGNVDAAIESARAAVKVRPELEEHWRAAAELLERAGRPAEAADLVAGYARARQSREDVAQWWSRLKAKAGDAEGALAVERDALDFWEELHPGEETELGERTARAASRLQELGLPAQAWSLLAPGGELESILASGLSTQQQTELAMGAGRLEQLLDAKQADAAWLLEAASTIRAQATPIQLEQVVRMAVARCSTGQALATWWSFATSAGVGVEVGIALATPHVAAVPGPWQDAAPATFLEVVGNRMVGRATTGEWVLLSPDLAPLWVLELVESGREDDLVRFLEPLIQELLSRARGSDPIAENEVSSFSTWLDAEGCRALASGLSRRADLLGAIEQVLSDGSAARRFWALAGRRLSMGPILESTSAATRAAWFQAMVLPPGTAGAETIAGSSRIAASLVSGESLAATDPLLAKLRGPRDVGAALKPAPAWRFDDLEKSVLPVPLWGEAPREPWLAFETLARFRLAEADAGAVPLESASLGSENARVRLGMRLALASGHPERALALDEAAPRSGVDLGRLGVRSRALRASGGADGLRREWSAEVARIQGRLDVETYRELRGLAFELGLPDPAEMMEPGTPIGAALLAHLVVESGPAVATRLHTTDAYQLDQELSGAIASREHISPELFRYYVENVWVDSYATMLRSWSDDMGGIWKASYELTRDLSVDQRGPVVKALLAYPETSLLESVIATNEEASAVLGPWLDLARGDDAKAEERVRALLTGSTDDSVWGEEGEPAREVTRFGVLPPFEPQLDGDRTASRLHDALAPFRAAGAGRAARIEAEVRKFAIERIRRGSFSARGVALALECSPDAASRAAVITEVERAWVRGDVTTDHVPALVEVLAGHDGAAARRFLGRWSPQRSAPDVRRHARAAIQLGMPADAARELGLGRNVGSWPIADQVRAFLLFAIAVDRAGRADTREALAMAPDWEATLGIDDAALGPRVAAMPLDVFAASRLLGRPDPLDRQTVAVARRALSARGLLPERDRKMLSIREVRALAGQSDAGSREEALVAAGKPGDAGSGAGTARRAAFRRLGVVDLGELVRDLEADGIPAAAVDGLLVDVGAGAASAGETKLRAEALRLLEERGNREARARVAAEPTPRLVGPIRQEGSLAAPYLPKDLDLALVERIVEGMEPRS